MLIKKMEENEDFKTYDLGLAATLFVKGFKIIGLDKENPRKVKFSFKRDNRRGDIEELSNQYFSDMVTLPAQKYFNAIKTLKNMLYSN